VPRTWLRPGDAPARRAALLFLTGLTARAAGAACVSAVSLKAGNPVPLYAAAADVVRWPFSFSNPGSTFYNLTITVDVNASAGARVYLPGSLSVTLTGGAVLTSTAWGPTAAGPWTAGEPPAGTAEPFALQWVVTPVNAGSSGALSFQTQVQSGSAAVLITTASATLACNAAGTQTATVPYSATATGMRIVSPLAWIRTYDAPAHGSDAANSVAVDPAGNVVAAGKVNRSDLNQGDNWEVRKYSGTGGFLWENTYHNASSTLAEEAVALAANPSGTAYLVIGFQDTGAGGGNNMKDWYLQLLTTSGATVWAGPYKPTKYDDLGTGVAFDAANNEYFSGTYGSTAGPDWICYKTDPATNLISWDFYAGPDGAADVPRAIAIDARNNGIAWGGSQTWGAAQRWLLRKYEISGTIMALAWTASLDGASSGDNELRSLAVDSHGSVLAAGCESCNLTPGAQWVVRKYDVTGHLLWTIRDPGSAGDAVLAESIAVDADRNVSVAGSAYRGSAGQGWNWVVRRYDSAGNPLDAQEHDGLIGGDEFAHGLAVVPGTPDVVVGGQEAVQGEAGDFTVARYTLASFHPPAPPGGLSALPSFAGDILTWTPVNPGAAPSSPVSGYVIYRATAPGFAPSLSTRLGFATGPMTASYTDAGVSGGVTYTYIVRAVDAAGNESANSQLATVTATSLLVITVTSSSAYDFASVAGGTATVSATTFDVRNDSTLAVTYLLGGANASGWTLTASGAPGLDQCELDAQFNYPSVPASWSPANDALRVMPPGPDQCSLTRFAGSETGTGVLPGQVRHLWVRLLAPSTTTQAGRQRLVITLSAQSP